MCLGFLGVCVCLPLPLFVFVFVALSSSVLLSKITFCILSTLGFGGALRYISSDLSETTVKILTEHLGFVNDCTFLQSSEGQLLASVGGNFALCL